MPRKARMYQKALCYHVFNRGLNKHPIFSNADDYIHFANTVKRYKDRCQVKIYHWCWMPNHYHMVIEVSFDFLRSFVGGLQQSYTQYHHLKHRSSGPFWDGRYHSKPIEQGLYLARCGRYVERNPVRADMVSNADAYTWSSASYYTKGSEDPLCDPNPYICGDSFTSVDRRAYESALSSNQDDEWMCEQEKQRAIGSDEFAKKLVKRSGRSKWKPGGN